MHNVRKSLLALMLVTMTISCTAQNEEVYVTANTNLCPNCFNQYRMLDSIDEAIPLHLVFQSSNLKEAKKFSDKFLHITRGFDFICDDSLYASLSHNIFPWLYYYKESVLIFDANFNQSEKWIPIINRLHEHFIFQIIGQRHT